MFDTGVPRRCWPKEGCITHGCSMSRIVVKSGLTEKGVFFVGMHQYKFDLKSTVRRRQIYSIAFSSGVTCAELVKISDGYLCRLRREGLFSMSYGGLTWGFI